MGDLELFTRWNECTHAPNGASTCFTKGERPKPRPLALRGPRWCQLSSATIRNKRTGSSPNTIADAADSFGVDFTNGFRAHGFTTGFGGSTWRWSPRTWSCERTRRYICSWRVCCVRDKPGNVQVYYMNDFRCVTCMTKS